MVATEVLLPLARCQRCLLKATDHFCSSDTINSLRVEVGQNGRGSTMRNREPRAEPAQPHTHGA